MMTGGLVLMLAVSEHFLDYLERQAIDAQFAAMADDEDYRTLSLALEEEFTMSDWEVFKLGEAEL